MTMRSKFVRSGRQFLLGATVALGLAGSALAQSASSAKPASTASDEGGYSKWDITPFFGWQWFQAYQGTNHRNYDAWLKNGWLFGEHFNFDFSNHASIEASLEIGSNRLYLHPFGQSGVPNVSIPSKNLQVPLDFVYHFQPRTSKNRLYVEGGPEAVWYFPGSTLGPAAVGNFVPPQFPLKKRVEPAVHYAVGFKHYISPLYGVRFEVGGHVGPRSHFNLPGGPTGPNTVYMTPGGNFSTLYFGVGVILREGYVYPPPPPNPLINQAMRVDLAAAPTTAPTISGGHDVCPGDDLRLSVTSGFPNPTYSWQVGGQAAAGANTNTYSVPTNGGSGSRSVTAVVTPGPTVGTSAPFTTSPGHTYHLTVEAPNLGNRNATYQWTVNGQPVAGATGSSYDLPDSGTATVAVQVSAANSPVTSAPANFTINQLAPPTLTFAVNPSTVPYSSGPIALNASATPSPCGGTVTVRYSGEGVTGNSFNPGSVSGFDMGNRLRPQSKTVTLTATATDAKGQTATRTAPVTVTLDPEARRLDDVVFPNLSSRVNNCGKRLLLEELTPMLRNDPGAKVVLIGHRDEKERNKNLDTARVINAAAVLSAGKGICPSLDLSRILSKSVGTDQSATPRPALCGSSTNVKERSGQAIKDSDKNAEFRRVEVWIIPSGAATPSGLSDATPVPAAAVSKVGCPK